MSWNMTSPFAELNKQEKREEEKIPCPRVGGHFAPQNKED